MMNPPTISNEPPSPKDIFLVQEFWKETIKQADRMDDLAKELFKLEIAIPGVFATVIKLYSDKGGVLGSGFLIAAFVCWAAALAITLVGITPKKYDVLEDVPEKINPSSETKRLSIRQFYEAAACRKQNCLVWASAVFFCGIMLAGASVIF